MAIEITIKPWRRLEGKIASEVLNAPKTCGDLKGSDWPEISESIVGYIEHNVVGQPWADQIALAAVVLTARRRQTNTVYNILSVVVPRLKAIFEEMKILSFDQLDITTTFQSYLSGNLLPLDSLNMRNSFWRRYNSAITQMRSWLDSLPNNEKEIYRKFLLPFPDRTALHNINKLSSETNQNAKIERKIDTDAMFLAFP